MISCPHCNGQKQVFAFINRGPDISTHTSGMIDCDTCKGSGSITLEQVQCIEVGQQLRKDRLERGRTLSEAAVRFGVSVTQYSAWERGRME